MPEKEAAKTVAPDAPITWPTFRSTDALLAMATLMLPCSWADAPPNRFLSSPADTGLGAHCGLASGWSRVIAGGIPTTPSWGFLDI